MNANQSKQQSNTQAKATRGARKEKPSARLVVAYALLQMVRQSAYSNLVAESRFDTLDSPRDRAFASTLFYGVLERQITLRRIVASYCRKPVDKLDPEVLCALEMGLYQLLFLDSVPERAAVNESVLLTRKLGKQSASGFVNGVLRAFIRDGKPLCPGAEKLSPLERLSAEASAPEELCRLLMEQYGEKTARQFLLDSLEPAPVFVRANTTRVTPEKLRSELEQAGTGVEETVLPACLRLEKPGDVTAYAAFGEGRFHVQDLSSQLCCQSLDVRPGMRVLDACSAPGGKTFTLAEQMENQGEVVACDLYPARVGLIQSGAERLGLSIVHPRVMDASAPDEGIGTFDRVLCDVPCSGLGIIRRKPELKYKPVAEFEGLPGVQYGILTACARLVKPGGVLVYSTCTLNRKENEEVIRRFLGEHPEFEPYAVTKDGGFFRTLLPETDGSDGFFFSAVRRIS